MDPRTNPYSPGAGLRPPVLSGRDGDLAAFDVLLDRAAKGLNSRSMVLTGLRGVGKTVLLSELAGMASQRGWIVAKVEAEHTAATDQFAVALSAALTRAVRRQRTWMGRATGVVGEAIATLAAFNVTVNPTGAVTFGVTIERGAADSGSLQADLPDLTSALAEAAKDDGVGVVVLIDEMQELDAAQMSAICRACHHAGQDGLPFYTVGAGLPNLAAALAEAESYVERLFEYRLIDRLPEPAAREALTGPATQNGVSWTAAAADVALAESRGYPYFIQQFGKSTWDAAVGDHEITIDDALLGVTDGQQMLDNGLYTSRWERATPGEREMLRMMALDNDAPSAIGEVAQRLGRPTTAISPTRAQLIAKGIVYSPERGQIAFTVPSMADFVRRIDASR